MPILDALINVAGYLLLGILGLFCLIVTFKPMPKQRHQGSPEWCRTLGVDRDGIPLWRRNKKLVNVHDGPDGHKIVAATCDLKHGESKMMQVRGLDGKMYSIVISRP